MKRVLSLLLLLVCFTLLFSCAKQPAETTAPSTTAALPATETVQVTIVNKSGEVVVALESVEATDLDADGKVNIYETLKAAHKNCPNGGADGFVTVDSQYGLSVTKLWGEENSGSFGYYQNEVMAMGLTDEVHTGDRLVAFSFTDAAGYSDRFSYFAPQTASVNDGESVTLTLTALIPDESWNFVPTLIEGATISINGTATQFKTDAEGKVTLTLAKGENLITATCSEPLLVTSVAKITVQ